MLFYIAIHKDENSVFGTSVPALNGCFSYGDSLEEALENTKEAIQFHLEGYLEDGVELEIQPQVLDQLTVDPDYKDAQWIGIDFDISNFTLKPERFNVSWPKYLLNIVDEYVQKNHSNRSNFLAKLAMDKITEQNKKQNKVQ